ncbi:MAG TPA: hypothetical protein VKM72_09645 [Thermoanaerobaculia bacterium]|nr:hypothetical protein [Thermoanaerobaculia bacterium]
MGRTRNPTRTVTFTVSTTPTVRGYLEALVERGLYGKNVAEAAERLLSEKLREIEGMQDYANTFSDVRNRIKKTEEKTD